MAIPKGHSENFKTMLRAAANGDLALIECKDAKNGKPRYVICAIAWNGKTYEIAPFGHL
jgi:hypothetical protein